MEAGIKQMVQEYNSGFDKWRVGTKSLVDLVDGKVRELEGKIDKMGSEHANSPNLTHIHGRINQIEAAMANLRQDPKAHVPANHYIGTLKQKKVVVLTLG